MASHARDRTVMSPSTFFAIILNAMENTVGTVGNGGSALEANSAPAPNSETSYANGTAGGNRVGRSTCTRFW